MHTRERIDESRLGGMIYAVGVHVLTLLLVSLDSLICVQLIRICAVLIYVRERMHICRCPP